MFSVGCLRNWFVNGDPVGQRWVDSFKFKFVLVHINFDKVDWCGLEFSLLVALLIMQFRLGQCYCGKGIAVTFRSWH